jgi:hypothetical protein
VLPCPVCKAENAQGPNCRRCKADLSLLFRLEEARDRLLASSAECLRTGRFAEALRHAQWAHALRRGEQSARLLALTNLLLRDFPAVWGNRQRSANG